MSSIKETIERKRFSEPSEGIGRTLIAEPSANLSANDLLDRVAEVWAVVSTWGRWCDEDMGDWPEQTDALATLPLWFQRILKQERDFEITNWLDDIHDREWIWWNGSILNDHLVKIDLCTDAMPISTWAIELVIEKSGGIVKRRGDWVKDVGQGGL
jgi:hypothetical protein